jgi:hypothetical protein
LADRAAPDVINSWIISDATDVSAGLAAQILPAGAATSVDGKPSEVRFKSNCEIL